MIPTITIASHAATIAAGVQPHARTVSPLARFLALFMQSWPRLIFVFPKVQHGAPPEHNLDRLTFATSYVC